jgi:hypothetical protein
MAQVIQSKESFGIVNATRVYRKLQCGDNRSHVLSIPAKWVKDWEEKGSSRLCGYVRMTRNPDSSILLEGV